MNDKSRFEEFFFNNNDNLYRDITRVQFPIFNIFKLILATMVILGLLGVLFILFVGWLPQAGVKPRLPGRESGK